MAHSTKATRRYAIAELTAAAEAAAAAEARYNAAVRRFVGPMLAAFVARAPQWRAVLDCAMDWDVLQSFAVRTVLTPRLLAGSWCVRSPASFASPLCRSCSRDASAPS